MSKSELVLIRCRGKLTTLLDYNFDSFREPDHLPFLLARYRLTAPQSLLYANPLPSPIAPLHLATTEYSPVALPICRITFSSRRSASRMRMCS